MPLERFAYKKADNPSVAPADGTMLTLDFDPGAYPLFNPYGAQNRAPDGSIVYMGAGEIRILLPTLKLTGKADGTAGTTGTAVELMAEWRAAVNETDARVWINYWNPETQAWVKQVARLMRPDLPARVGGAEVVQGLELVLRALGISSATWAGGSPTTPADAPAAPGDPAPGVFGYKRFGYGVFGQGETP